MSHDDNQRWLQAWRDSAICDFHQKKTNPLLMRFWNTLDLPPGSRIFVPLCGKSLDLLWLADQGFEVIGIEISPLAVKAFFHENRLPARHERCGRLNLWRSGPISIYCGDIFSLQLEQLGHIDAVYDRAALTAMPELLRARYAEHLQSLLPVEASMLLLTIEDSEAASPGSQTDGIDHELSQLFSASYAIALTHSESLNDRPDQPALSADCKVYHLTTHPA
jgi:thiopurine S-methyltransferase